MPKEQIVVQLNPDVTPSGSDLAVCNAARRSFGKRSEWIDVTTKGVDVTHYPDKHLYETHKELKPEDKRLIEFLARGLTAKDFEQFKLDVGGEGLDWLYYMNNNREQNLIELLWKWRNTPTHDTPFNHCHISFEVKAPIFVARQLVKTEYTVLSEFSRRYITDDVEFYTHDYREASKDKKQGSGGTHKDNAHWQKKALQQNKQALDLYNSMIANGVAPEQARGVLPVDLMTSWTWSATLGAFAKMCRERLGSDAQAESRYVAEKVYGFMKQYYPVSAKALVEGC